jgi:cell division protein FtsL
MTPPNDKTSSTVSQNRPVPVAQINRKVLWITVAVATAVVALSFVSLIVHGLILSGKW